MKKHTPDIYTLDLFSDDNENSIKNDNSQIPKIITFGKKYIGKPIEVLENDRDYCKWLVNQPWFKERYYSIYQIIINNFNVPKDTPAHNKLQILFLEKNFCLALANLCGWNVMKKSNCIRNINNAISKLRKNYNNTTYGNNDIMEKIEDLIEHRDYIDTTVFLQDGIEYLDGDLPLFKINNKYEEEGWDVIIQSDCGFGKSDCQAFKECSINNKKIAIEIKPTFGDDYADVLRQIKHNNTHPYYQCLV